MCDRVDYGLFDYDLFDYEYLDYEDLLDLDYLTAAADLLDDDLEDLDRILVGIGRLSRDSLDYIALANARLSGTDMAAEAIDCLLDCLARRDLRDMLILGVARGGAA